MCGKLAGNLIVGLRPEKKVEGSSALMPEVEDNDSDKTKKLAESSDKWLRSELFSGGKYNINDPTPSHAK